MPIDGALFNSVGKPTSLVTRRMGGHSYGRHQKAEKARSESVEKSASVPIHNLNEF